MFHVSKNAPRQPKIHVAHGRLPSYIDRGQLPSSKAPFSIMLDQYWSHTVDLLLPKSLYESVWPQVAQTLSKTHYSKVIMSLYQLLDGDFFNLYIKTGNISMLSERCAGLDCHYSLREGVLRLEMTKEKYERAGLVGRPMPEGGRKHVKTRYAVILNLRETSMVRGKKGFDRVLWACNNVLSESLTWLFVDHDAEKTLHSGSVPISLHHPTNEALSPTISHHSQVLMPSLDPSALLESFDEDDSMGLLEWLGMLALQSPRVDCDDSIDPFLARYQISSQQEAQSHDLVSVRWRGFIDAVWVRHLLVEWLAATRQDPHAWLALSAYSFTGQSVLPKDGYAMLQLPGITATTESEGQVSHIAHREYISWQMADTVEYR